MIAKSLINRGGKSLKRGMTLIEITVVIVVLITLVGVSIYGISGYREWQLSSEATQKLRMVYNAQRTYLSENPIVRVSSLTPALIIPYLSDGSDALPTVRGLDGVDYDIQVNVSPPVIGNGAGNVYDPSGSNTDGVWDVAR